MKGVPRYALSLGIAVSLLTGCGGLQPSSSTAGVVSPADLQTLQGPARDPDRQKTAVEFVYVANAISNNLSAYAINATDGTLTQIHGSPFASSYGPCGLAIDPTGKFVYVANDGTISGKTAGNVSGFAINPGSGALTPIPGSPFAAGSNPHAVAVSPNGRFIYVVNYSSTDVSIFAINAKTGGLRQIKSSPFKISRYPMGFAIDPIGKILYVAYLGYRSSYPGSIVGYAINAHSGALRKLRGVEIATNAYPVSETISPSSKFLYVVNNLSYVVSGYAIDTRTGALKEVRGSPFEAGTDPTAVAIDPVRPFAYVVYDLEVAGYAIARDGALTPVAGSPFGAGYLPNAAAIDPPGRFLYVANLGDDSVSGYVINASNGALTQVRGSPFAAGEHPTAIATCEIERDRCVPPAL